MIQLEELDLFRYVEKKSIHTHVGEERNVYLRSSLKNARVEICHKGNLV